ncbi:vitamin B12 ABC transporter permease BtuC [Vibrio sp.]
MQFSQLIQQKQRRWYHALWLMLCALIFSSAVYTMVGEVWIWPLASHTPLEQQLVVELRLPRLLAVILIGGALALSGATLQVLLGNVLAEPGILGISGGASVAMVVVLFFFPLLATPPVFMVAAVIGCLLFTLLLVMLAKTTHLTTTRLLLVGVALGILSGAVVTWAFYFSDNLSLRQLMYWLMGSVSGVSWYQHSLSLFALPVMAWLMLQGHQLDKLMLGESHAKQLGIDVLALRWKLIFAVAMLVGVSVALGGVIGFVGLVVPHLLRLLLGSENRMLLPLAAIGGALLLVLADMLARMILGGAELPLGVVTTTLGAPIFIWMLIKNHD